MRICRVAVKNFRCLRDVEVKLRPLSVLVGPNGAGKSSLLQVLRLFADARNDKDCVDKLIAKSGGFASALSHDATLSNISFEVGLGDECGTESARYRLELTGEGRSFAVSVDSLLIDNETVTSAPVGPGVAVFAAPSPAQVALPEAARRFPSGRALLDALERSLLYLGGRFQPNERIRSPQTFQLVTRPSNDGSDLFSAIYSLMTSDRDAFQNVVETLRIAMPEFLEFAFPPAGVGFVHLSLRQRDDRPDLNALQLSDGTLRLLWLLTLAYMAPEDGLLMIDEPELSLHPQWLQLMAAVLQDVSVRTNVLVATQSAELVRWLDPGELLVADTEETGTKFTWVDAHPNIEKWLKDFTLSELWTMGELGGRR